MKKAAAGVVSPSMSNPALSNPALSNTVLRDYFALFALPRSMDLDESALETAYFALQQHAHPDKMQAASTLERHAAMQRVSDANQGYRILRSPLHRAEHLLALAGIGMDGTNAPTLAPASLMEAMELRERKEAGEDIRAECAALQQTAAHDFTHYYAQAEYSQAAQALLRWKYAVKL